MNGLDLSQFSNQQLQALAQGDYSSLTNQQLQQLSQWHDQQTQLQQQQQQPTQPGPVQSAIAPVFGAGAAVAGAASAIPGAAFDLAKEHPAIATGVGVLYGKEIKQGIENYIKEPISRAAQSVKDIALQGLKGGTQAAANAARSLGSISPEAIGMGLRAGTGLGAMLYSPSLNEGEDAQVAATRAQYPQYYGQQPQQPNGGMQ